MRGMILAAGFGSRLRPLTDRIPKPLVEVAGRPMIAYAIDMLRAAGITDIMINLHHLSDQIAAALGTGATYGVRLAYSREDPILDTGGAIQKAEPFLRGGTFVVVNADIVTDLDVRTVVAWHCARGALATMVLRDDPCAAAFGLIDIDPASRVRRILGRPADAPGVLTPLMFASVHVFEPTVFAYMRPGRFGIIKTTYPALLAAGCPVYGYRFDGYWQVLDTHAGLAEGRWELAQRRW